MKLFEMICSDNIEQQLIEYANSKNEKIIYLYCLDVLVAWAQSAEYAIHIIEILRRKGIYLCFMEDCLRTDKIEDDEELKSSIYTTCARLAI